MKSEHIEISMEPVLVDSRMAAKMLGISVRHFSNLEVSGRLGPMAIKLGCRKLYSVEELKLWVRLGCQGRQAWQERGSE